MMTEAGPESRQDSKIKVATPVWPKLAVEWPTVFLFVGVILIAVTSTVFALHSPVFVWPLFVLINALCVYSIFTVMHEACHRNISRRFSKIEYLMGLVSGLMYHGSYEHFVALHLRHHAKVNVPGEDPDLHACGRLSWRLFFSWTTTLITYIQFYLKHKMVQNRSFLKVWLPYAFIFVVYALGVYRGFFVELLVFWLLPSMLGVAITTLVFDHLPHAPHSDTGKYTNARSFPDKRIDWFVFMHSYHIVHHLWPSIPWYRYREAYIQRRTDISAAGNREISIFTQSKM